ncbi:MAG: hypothetical protein ACT4P5_10625 [Armatimonadota bacterium]
MSTPTHTRILSGHEIRRLLVLRSQLRDGIVGLARRAQREILEALEEARQLRLYGRARTSAPPAMATDELIREIKWRIDAASLSELSAGARVLERAKRTGPSRFRPGDRRSARGDV